MPTKICRTCKIEKDVGEFYKDKSKKDGLRSQCKECEKLHKNLIRVKAREKKVCEKALREFRGVKICSKCKIEKDFGEFWKDKSKKDGLCNQCKECRNILRSKARENKESEKALREFRGVKICSTCKIEKDVGEFCKRVASKDGLCSHCKDCERAYQETYRKSPKGRAGRKSPKRKAWERAYRESQRGQETIKAAKKVYRESLKGQINEKAYNTSSRKKATDKAYRESPEGRIIIEAWLKSPEGRATASRKDQKRRKNGELVENTLTASEWKKIIKIQNNICNVCYEPFTKEDPPTKDHIIPLSPRDGSKGKGLTFENTQAVHKRCNSEKSNKKDPQFIQTWIGNMKKRVASV